MTSTSWSSLAPPLIYGLRLMVGIRQITYEQNSHTTYLMLPFEFEAHSHWLMKSPSHHCVGSLIAPVPPMLGMPSVHCYWAAAQDFKPQRRDAPAATL